MPAALCCRGNFLHSYQNESELIYFISEFILCCAIKFAKDYENVQSVAVVLFIQILLCFCCVLWYCVSLNNGGRRRGGCLTTSSIFDCHAWFLLHESMQLQSGQACLVYYMPCIIFFWTRLKIRAFRFY